MSNGHTSKSMKEHKEDQDALVKMAFLQTDFQKAFNDYRTDKTKAKDVISKGKELMELQKSSGKAGGGLSHDSVWHRVMVAEADVAKGLDKPVEKKASHTTKNIITKANGDTIWVLK